MSVRYLLDTNVVSEPLLARPNPHAIAWLEANVERSAIAAVSWHELRFGAARLPRGRKRERLESYLEGVIRATYAVLPYAESEAEWHAVERARLVAAGKTPAFADGQIAATAQVNGFALVTGNVRDFTHFRGLEVLPWPVVKRAR